LHVAYMCQQAVEKLVKGLFVLHKGEEPPRIHNIWNIFDRIFDIDKFEESENEGGVFVAEIPENIRKVLKTGIELSIN